MGGLILAAGTGLLSLRLPPPPPLSSRCPCLVSGGGGGGTITFHFPNFLRRLEFEVLLCVCWLDEVLLLPPAQPAAKRAPKAAKSHAKPSKRAAKPAAQVAAKPAAAEPISVAPVEHVQLFKVKYLRQTKWHTKPVTQ